MKTWRSWSALLVLACLLLVLVPAPAPAQGLPNLALVRVLYNTRKTVVKPQGDLKEQIDAIDRDLNEALRLGRAGEARRLMNKGIVLLSGSAWTDTLDYAGSLVLRADRAYVDAARPFVVRLEQIYRPSLALANSLTAHVTITRPAATSRDETAARLRGQRRGGAAAADGGALVKDLGTLEGVSRDLIEAPFPIEIDPARLDAGVYRVRVEVLDGTTPLGAHTLDFVVSRDLDARLRRIQTKAAAAPETYRAEALFPADHIRQASLGRIPMGAFDLSAELARAEHALRAIKAGKDPYAGRTGDLKRHYLLKDAGEIMPYRVYVPSRYDGTPRPLVIALHGLGATEDSFFEDYGGLVPKLAEQHGFLVAAPLGYRVDGGYGVSLSGAPGDAAARRVQQFSAEDVMEVLAQMKKLYHVDEHRIYLMGHSMGGIGTWRLAAAHPEIWAAIAPISGYGAPATVEAMRRIPEIVVHGDADPTVPVAGSRAMVAEMKRLGVEVKYIEVPGGNHIDVAAPNLPAIFQFFEEHSRQ